MVYTTAQYWCIYKEEGWREAVPMNWIGTKLNDLKEKLDGFVAILLDPTWTIERAKRL